MDKSLVNKKWLYYISKGHKNKKEFENYISKFFIISQKAAKIKKNVKISVKILFEHYIKKEFENCISKFFIIN